MANRSRRTTVALLLASLGIGAVLYGVGCSSSSSNDSSSTTATAGETMVLDVSYSGGKLALLGAYPSTTGLDAMPANADLATLGWHYLDESGQEIATGVLDDQRTATAEFDANGHADPEVATSAMIFSVRVPAVRGTLEIGPRSTSLESNQLAPQGFFSWLVNLFIPTPATSTATGSAAANAASGNNGTAPDLTKFVTSTSGCPFNLLFVPEAFTDTGEFDTAAANVAMQITTSTTYGAHASAFNMYRQEFTSATSTIPAFGQPPPNTAFAMQKSMGDGRCITTQGALPTATATKLAQGIRASNSTVVVVIVNTTDYGGCATSFGIAGAPHYITVTRNSAASKVVLHELGHSLIGLADEYPYGTCNVSAAESPNTSAKLMSLPWKDLVMDQLPTPVGTGGVGAFEGAKYCMNGVYRPTDEGCMMRRLDREMCPVCAREVTRTFSGRDSMKPAGADGGAAPANDSGLSGSLISSSTPLVCPSRHL